VITLRNVGRFFGDRKLFANVSAVIRPGDRIGLVGVNGTGKTTLLNILVGSNEPDEGEVFKSPHVRVGYLPQECNVFSKDPLDKYVMAISEELVILKARQRELEQRLEEEIAPEEAERLAQRHAEITQQIEHIGGYDLEARAKRILAGLGFPLGWFSRAVNTLSGGWIMRAELARILLSNPDVLLLDEPTNYLDWASLLWFEEFLREFRGATVIVSHDREFLNRVVTRIWELDGGEFLEYAGNYDEYQRQKRIRLEHQWSAYRQQQEKIRQLENFIARNRVRKDRAKQVQSRIKMLENMERIEPPREEEIVRFSFPEPPRAGKRVLELVKISKSYGELCLYTDLDLIVERGDRIAFVGVNGAGKTTLLKIMAGIVPPDKGERIVGSNVRIGYYAQHRLETLNSELTVFEEALSVAGDLTTGQLRQLLGAFRFGGEDVDKKVKVLSGGEKARLSLCKLLLERPNLLLLDEPTNHLDIRSREVLERALLDFGGTICFISHDRRFIDSLATKVLFFCDGRVELFHGNYSDFEKIWKDRLLEQATSGKSVEHRKKSRRDLDRKRLEAEWRNELYRLRRPLEQEIAEIEARLEQLQQEAEILQADLANPEVYKDGKKVQELQKRFGMVRKEIDELTLRWEDKAIELEELEKEFWRGKRREVVVA